MCSIVCATGQCEGVLKAGPWLGFRYNDQEVLVYTDQMRDSAEHRMDEVDRLHLPDPRAKWGGGGNLLPLTAERLSHFDALVPGKGSVTASVNKGTRMSVQVSADETIEGTSGPVGGTVGNGQPRRACRIPLEDSTRADGRLSVHHKRLFLGERRADAGRPGLKGCEHHCHSAARYESCAERSRGPAGRSSWFLLKKGGK